MMHFNERMNEQTHFFIKIYLSYFIIVRVMFLVCERWVGDKGRLLYWPKILLSTKAALLSHLGWVAQLWVTEGRKSLVCRLILMLASYLQLTQAICALVILLFNAHLLPLFFRLFTQVHLLIDSSVKGQYITHLNSAVVWMVLIHPFIFKPSSLLSKPLGTIPNPPFLIGITCHLHVPQVFLVLKQGLSTFFSLYFLWFSVCGSQRRHNPLYNNFSFFVLQLSLDLVICPG